MPTREAVPAERVDASPAGRPSWSWAASWAPTACTLGALVVFGLLIRLFGPFFDAHPDLTWLITLLLCAAFLAAVVPRLIEVLQPDASVTAKRVESVVVLFVVVVPLGVALLWSMYDVAHPVVRRAPGALPDLASIMGETQHDAERALGAASLVTQRDYSAPEVAAASRPWGTTTARYAIYAMPDLNVAAAPPSSRMALARAWARMASVFHAQPSQPWSNGAVAVIYLSPNGEVVGARIYLSRPVATKGEGRAAYDSFLHSSGFKAELVEEPPPAWWQQSVRSTDTAGGTDYWGFGRVGNGWVGYQVRAGASSSLLSSAGPRGETMLALGPGLLEGLTPPSIGTSGAGRARGQYASGSAGASTPAEPAAASAPDTFAGRTFYAIVVSQSASEADARSSAAWLNDSYSYPQRKGVRPFVVERSGHLRDLAAGDFWVVLYDTGYADETTAWTSAREELGGVAWWVNVVKVTKVCGDPTITSIRQ